MLRDILTRFYRIEAISSIRRRAGRSKNLEDAAGDATIISGPISKRRGGAKKTAVDDDADDASYEPVESEPVDEGDEDGEEDWEAAALAWGLITTGGLGTGSAGIYGAEITAR